MLTLYRLTDGLGGSIPKNGGRWVCSYESITTPTSTVGASMMFLDGSRNRKFTWAIDFPVRREALGVGGVMGSSSWRKKITLGSR